jgi:hypothetical protein
MVLNQPVGGLQDVFLVAGQQRREDVFFFIQVVLPGFGVEPVGQRTRLRLQCGCQLTLFQRGGQRHHLFELLLDVQMAPIQKHEKAFVNRGRCGGRCGHEGAPFKDTRTWRSIVGLMRCSILIWLK